MLAELITVVMPSRNQRRFVPSSVDSALKQHGVRAELIVVDGGSTDGTLEWLSSRASEDSRLRFHSQPDSGPAQAVNRAMARARGTLIGWLNSDDLYTEGALERAVAALATHPDWLMVYGHAEHVDAAGQVIGPYPTRPPSTPIKEFADGCFICQPSVVMRRTFLLLNGPLDEGLRTAFDFEWWLRAFARFPERIGFIEQVQARSRLHEGAITLRQRKTVAIEGMKVLHRHLGSAPSHWIKTWVNEGIQSGELVGPRDPAIFDVVSQVDAWMPPADRAEIRAWLLERSGF